MTHSLAGATFALVAACLAISGPAWAAGAAIAQAGGDAEACRASIEALRQQVAGGDGPTDGDHKLLGGLSAEAAGEPQENWFGSPTDSEAMLKKLDEAGRLADEGDAEGCRQLVEEVEKSISEPSPAGGSG